MRSSPCAVVAIVPCLNEEATVGAVVRDLIATVPGITVFVFDNGSTDRTVERAAEAGAVVRHELRRGKGNVVRRAFGDLQADVFVLIDGDDTYDVAALPDMIALLHSGPYDQVVGVRRETGPSAYRRGHSTGNVAFNAVVSRLFGQPVQDMLTGYRVLSERFVKSFPVRSRGFEVETEMTVHSVGLRVPTAYVDVGFRDRPLGSASKLRTYHDGFRILGLIVRLARYERPQPFHAVIACVLALVSLALGLPVILEYFDTGLVRRFPTAILASSIAVIAVLALVMGMLLEANRRVRDEGARLAYLRLPPPEHR
jgi:glycosyltransferase involved in cell wall biosynthesis